MPPARLLAADAVLVPPHTHTLSCARTGARPHGGRAHAPRVTTFSVNGARLAGMAHCRRRKQHVTTDSTCVSPPTCPTNAAGRRIRTPAPPLPPRHPSQPQPSPDSHQRQHPLQCHPRGSGPCMPVTSALRCASPPACNRNAAGRRIRVTAVVKAGSMPYWRCLKLRGGRRFFHD